MSEWPELDTYRRLLSPLICGQTIQAVEVLREQAINEPIGDYRDGLTGRKVLFVERRGKTLLLHLDDGNRLLLNLLPGGWLFYGTNPEEAGRTQVALTFEDGNRLFFGGVKAGTLHRLSAKSVQELFRPLGPDPFDVRLTEEAFVKRIGTRRGKLKATIVDQKLVSGIGSRYADEICFNAEVLPSAAIPELTDATKRRLYHSMRKVLEEAGRRKAGALDHKVTADDTFSGGFRGRMLAYDREGSVCLRCGGTIRLETAGSRKMYDCPGCQKPS